MNILTHRHSSPSEQDSELARVSGERLAYYLKQKRRVTLQVGDSDHEEPIELPLGTVSLLMDILEAIANGQAVTLLSENSELSTVEAADMLNVSRPFLIKLLENGDIPHRKVGKHRRVRMDDMLTYKTRDDREREAIRDQLVREAQEQGMGY